MRNIFLFRSHSGIPLALAVSLVAALGLTALGGQPGTPAEISSRIENQKNVAVTVYNSNLGLVRDTREIALPRGASSVRFMDVASQIDPTSVLIKSLDHAADLRVVEQNYEYDLLNPQKLLEKYVGKEVTLLLSQRVNGSDQFVEQPATLLSNNNGQQVWRIGKDIVINPANIAQIKFPQLPENLIAEPTLVWTLESERSESHQVEASYLTSGMNWDATYVLLVDSADKKADLNGWVTLKNNSGTEFRNAELKLVAGTINRAPQGQPPAMEYRQGAVAAAKPQFQEESFFEYHLYTLDRRTTLRNNESKQISLLSANSVPVEKQFVVASNSYYYQGYNNLNGVVKENVGVYLQFTNSDSNHLGMPLPAGTVRMYKADSKGSQQLIGEDRIGHTPKDEQVRLKVGDAFDVTAERRQTSYQTLSRNLYEYGYEISIRNHKQENITVRAMETINGDWEILSSSFPPQKLSAFHVAFDVPVAKDGSATLAYRVRVRY